MFYRGLLVLTALLTAACSHKDHVTQPRYAVLRFENLSPLPSLNWVGRAVSEVLTNEIGAIPSATLYRTLESSGRRPHRAPGVSTGWSAALLSGANRIVTGYYEQVHGKLRFTAVEQDAQTGKTLKETTVEGSLLDVCNTLAHTFTANIKHPATTGETALQYFVEASDGEPDASYEKAVAADPKFSAAYLAWTDTAITQRDAATLARILAGARASGLRDGTVERIEFAAASLAGDNPARLAALRNIVKIDPSDANAVKALAESQMIPGHFREAAATYSQGASAAQPDLYNLKAYALMYGGDEQGALAAIQQYRNARPQDPNALDSQGDVQLFFGHFAEAEKLYLAAAAKDPHFNESGEIWKAARAHLMTGDVKGASQVFSRYRLEKTNPGDPALAFRSAYWLFISGGRQAGISAMHQLAARAADATLKSASLTQAGIWEAQFGQKTDAARDAEAAMRLAQNTTLIPAAVVRFAALPTVPVEQLQLSADRAFNGTAGVHIRPVAVAYTAFLNKEFPAATLAWKQIYEHSNPSDQSALFLYAGSLQQSGHAAEAAPLLKYNPIASASLNPSFESLYFPALFEWRGDRATYLKLLDNTATQAK